MTPPKAEEIKDFQIEGMSVGVSLLEYFDKNYIKKNKTYFSQAKGNKKYAKLNIDSSTYESVMITFKDDKKLKIVAIEGFIYNNNDIKSCLAKRDKVIKELSEMFKDKLQYDFGKQKHFADENSYTHTYIFGFGSRAELATPYYDAVTVSCYDWSKQLPYDDEFRISIRLKDLNKWLNSLNL